VQPFRSALVGAAQQAMAQGGATNVALQPVTIAYTHLQGMAVSRNERSGISGVASKGARQVIRDLLRSGVKDVTVQFGEPMPLDAAADRKVVTRLAEDEVRRTLVALNRNVPIASAATASPLTT